MVADLPVGILVDDCPLYDLEPAPRRPRALYAPPPVVLAPRRRAPARPCSRCWARPTWPRAGPCSSSTTRSCSRAPCAGPRRPTPPCCAAARTASAIAVVDRRQRAPGRLRPARRGGRGGLRVRGQPRLRRRRAARADQLPELRQPREAARRLAADRGGRGDRARPASALGVPVVGGNVSLYNEAPDRADLPDAGDRHGRPAARSRPAPAGSGFAGDGDAIALVGSLAAASPAGSELAKLRGEPIAGPLPRARSRARSASAHAVVRDARPRRRAGQRPRRRRGRAGRGPGRGLPGRRRPGSAPRSRCPTGSTRSARLPGGRSWSPGRDGAGGAARRRR